MKDYIPELSEIRMIRRAPNVPPRFSAEDAAYVEACLRATEQAFGVALAPGAAFSAIPARLLIKFCIESWRGLVPQTPEQQEAHGRLPSTIRLLDTYSALEAERGPRR
jgi:hypothetical protein